MVLELIVKKEAPDKSHHDQLRARNATSHTFSFDEFTRMLFNFYYTMLLARREKHEPGNHLERLSNGTKDGKPVEGVHVLWSCPSSYSFNSTFTSSTYNYGAWVLCRALF